MYKVVKRYRQNAVRRPKLWPAPATTPELARISGITSANALLVRFCCENNTNNTNS